MEKKERKPRGGVWMINPSNGEGYWQLPVQKHLKSKAYKTTPTKINNVRLRTGRDD